MPAKDGNSKKALASNEDPSVDTWRRDHADDCRFGPDYMQFQHYPFYPSSVRADPIVHASEIEEIDLNGAPPTVRLERELLFVGAPFREELRVFAQRNGIPIRRRFDIWAAILEPFLDTQFDTGHQRERLMELQAHGVSTDEVREFRKRVGPRMLAVNSVLWEWVHLGHNDVLTYTKPWFFGRGKYREFYWRSMELALRAYREGVPGNPESGI